MELHYLEPDWLEEEKLKKSQRALEKRIERRSADLLGTELAGKLYAQVVYHERITPAVSGRAFFFAEKCNRCGACPVCPYGDQILHTKNPNDLTL